MKALRIALQTARPVTLRTRHLNSKIHGLINDCWRENMPWEHDRRYGRRNEINLLVFGPLSGDISHPQGGRATIIDGVVIFEVRSPIDERIDEIAHQLATRRTARLDEHEMRVVNLEVADRLVFPSPAVVKTISPILALHGTKTGKEALGPADAGWADVIRGNAREKAYALGLDDQLADEMQVIAYPNSLRDQKVTFKGKMFKCWDATLLIACDEQLVEVLYYCGLGSKNCDGFGMLAVVDRLP